MGSFTQGGIALGQSLGGGIENYVAGRERRELLVGKALGIADMLQKDEKRSDEDNKYLKKFDDVNEMGTRQLQGLISEFETGEELQMIDMKRRLASAQTEAAEAKLSSMKGLGDFASKGMSATEAGFEGDAWAVPEYLTKDYLEGDRGQRNIEAGAFPGAHYGDESRAIYENISTIPEGETRSDEIRIGSAAPGSGVPPLGEVQPSAPPMEQLKWLRKAGAIGDKNKVYMKNDALGRKIENLRSNVLEADSRVESDRSGGKHNSNSYIKGALDRALNEKKELVANNPWLIPTDLKELDPVVIPNTMADVPPLQSEVGGPSKTQQKVVGYDTYNDIDVLSAQNAPLDRYAATGGTGVTPVDERRGQLIDSLAQYNLTPTDRKQAIDMISEKYPKLKEIATGIESPEGKSLGFTIGNTFIPAKQSVGGASAGAEGLELTSITVNDKGEVTRILKPKEDLEKGQKVLLANSKEFKHQAKKLLEVVDSHGNWESAFSAFFSDSSATAKAELDSLAFRMAILYSKIVDPDTAAREGEVVAAKKYAFQMGFFTPNGVTKASVNSMLAEVMRRESSLYEQEGIDAPHAQGAGEATNPADPVKLGI